MKKTICGTVLSTTGDLLSVINGLPTSMKSISYDYNGKRLLFCEHECLDEFLKSVDKENWILNHK